MYKGQKTKKTSGSPYGEKSAVNYHKGEEKIIKRGARRRKRNQMTGKKKVKDEKDGIERGVAGNLSRVYKEKGKNRGQLS